MHTGKIKKVVREKGFGFISDTDGGEVFFHKNNLLGASFDSLAGGESVEFDVEKTPKGNSAIKVSILNT